LDPIQENFDEEDNVSKSPNKKGKKKYLLPKKLTFGFNYLFSSMRSDSGSKAERRNTGFAFSGGKNED